MGAEHTEGESRVTGVDSWKTEEGRKCAECTRGGAAQMSHSFY